MRIDIDTCREPDLLAAEVRRLKAVIAASQPTLTEEEREAVEAGLGEIEGVYPETAATLRGLLERLGDTPATHATPSESSEQNGCTLTDKEREALNRGIDALCGVEDVSDGACRRDDAAARTLLALLERLT